MTKEGGKKKKACIAYTDLYSVISNMSVGFGRYAAWKI